MKLAPFLALTTLSLALAPASHAQTSDSQPVAIQFQPMVGDRPFSCGEQYLLGSPEAMVTPTDFRLYVSDVMLIDADGNTVPVSLEQDNQWQYQNVALLDFEDRTGACANGTAEIRTQIVGTAPTGDYQGLRFTLGIPFELNHEDSTLAPSPLNLTALWWNWQFGYKFLRADFVNHSLSSTDASPDASLVDTSQASEKNEGHLGHRPSDHGDDHSAHGAQQAAAGIAIHIGSTGCTLEGDSLQPNTCSNPNRADVVLNGFDPAQDVVVVDLAALVQGNDLMSNAPNTPMGCMSSPEDSDCLGIMSSLGIPFNGDSAPEQTFFRKR